MLVKGFISWNYALAAIIITCGSFKVAMFLLSVHGFFCCHPCKGLINWNQNCFFLLISTSLLMPYSRHTEL